MRLTAQDLREMNILKYYRLVRKWVCKTYGIKDADLELLIYLDCKGRFTRKDFMDGVYTYSWDKARWERLRRGGKFYNNKSYTDKVYNKAIDDMIKDKDR